MAIALHAETVYAYRRLDRVIVGAAAEGDVRPLARIEQLLVGAADHYRSRRYLDAVRQYTEVRRLVWSQLLPFSRAAVSGVRSYAVQWWRRASAAATEVPVEDRLQRSLVWRFAEGKP